MQEFTVFDMVVVGITILLGLKGLFRGLIKEVFGLVGIVGGIYVASRASLEVGNIIKPILALENEATVKLIGFILGLIGFWLVVYVLGLILSKIFKASGLGIFDRIFGFLFGSAKIFFIFSIIAYGMYQMQSFKSLFDEKFGNTITFPYLLETGSLIVKLDTASFTNTDTEEQKQEKPEAVKENIADKVKETVSEIKETTVESTNAVLDTVQKSVEQKIEDTANEAKKTAQEAVKKIEENSTQTTENK